MCQRVLRGYLGSPKGAAQERQRAPESPRGLQRGSPMRVAVGRGCAARKETETKTKNKFKDIAKALRLSHSLSLRGWTFKDSLETRNALVPKGAVADKNELAEILGLWFAEQNASNINKRLQNVWDSDSHNNT